MAKKNKKNLTTVDTKKAAANDKPEVQVEATTAPATAAVAAPVAKEVVIRKSDSAVMKGSKFASLAGRPSKQLVTRIFGKTGYSYSWLKRAEILGVEATQLCADFVSNAESVKARWEAATTKAPKVEAAVAGAK